jgi:uncharacterized membrane protein YfcA
MDQRNVALNRTLAGILAIGCGIAGVVLIATRGIDDQFGAGFIRVALVFGALWFAMPSRSREAAWARVSPWMVVGVVLVAVLLVRHLRVLLPVILVLAAAGYVLRPRKDGPREPRAEHAYLVLN